MLVLRSRVSRVDAVAFSPDGSLLAVAGTNGVELWSVYTHERLWRWENSSGLRDIANLYFSRQGYLLADPSAGFDLLLFDIKTGKYCEVGFPYSGDGCLASAWDPVAEHVVVSSQYRISCWRFRERQEPKATEHPFERIVVWDTPMSTENFGPMLFRQLPETDGQPAAREVWTLANNAWHLRNADTGETKLMRRSSSTKVHELQLSLDGSFILGRHMAHLFVWPLVQLRNPLRISKENKRQFTGMAWHPSGQYLATASNDKAIRLWDVQSWQTLKTFEWKAGRMRSIAISPDGLMAAAGGELGEFVLFDFDL